MPETLSVAESVELAVVERAGFVESRHAGAAIVLSPEGEVAASFGGADALVLPRSSLKPFQAIACVTAGATLDGERLAMATASHSGTGRHADVVRGMLQEAGLTEDDLRCPAAWPGDTATRDELVREHATATRIRMNCSGKHAAMLAACVANGWSTTDYLDPTHPVQAHIREVVERLCGAKVAATVTDGCGAPVHALALSELARGVHRIAASSERSPFALHRVAGTLVREVKANPWTIDGPGRADTAVIERFGVFSKLGAEGVQVMAAPDGTTVALKMLDGANRAGSAVALSLLARAGALPADEVGDFLATSALYVLLGGGREVGRIRSAFALA